MTPIFTGLLMFLLIGGYLVYWYMNKDKGTAKNLAAMGLSAGEAVVVMVGGTLEGRELTAGEQAQNAVTALLGSETQLNTGRKVLISVTPAGRVVVSDGTAPIAEFARGDVTRFERGALMFNMNDGHLVGERKPYQLVGPNGQLSDVYRYQLERAGAEVMSLLLPESGGTPLAAALRS